MTIIDQSYVKYQPLTLIISGNGSMLDVVLKVKSMLVVYIPLKKPCHIYWIFLDLFNRCTQNIDFTLGKIGKSSVLKGLKVKFSEQFNHILIYHQPLTANKIELGSWHLFALGHYFHLIAVVCNLNKVSYRCNIKQKIKKV